MNELAAFLRTDQAAIVAVFEELRPAARLTPRVAAMLDAIADALEHGTSPRAIPTEGWSSVDQLISELAGFRDAIYDVLEARGVTPSLRELRVLGNLMARVMKEGERIFTTRHDGLVEAERRALLELFEQSPSFLAFVRGKDLVYELENEAYHRIIGNRPIHGKPMREALPELAGQGFFETLEGIIESGIPVIGRKMQAQLQLKPNAPLETVYVDYIFQPIRDASGEVVGVLMQGNDLTAVYREEAARREAEERYRTLFESIDDGYCLMQMIDDASGKTIDYRFLEANAAFEGQTGLVGALGKTALELVPNLDSSWFDRYGSVAKTGVSSRFESHAAAMGRWFDVYASRVGDPTHKLVALVFKDITARKEAEVEREGLLERESAARKEAEAASRLRDDFLATVSHELRTPLNAMLGWVQILRTGALAPEKQAHALETIERNARAQTALVDDLLDVTRILAGKLRLELEAVNLEHFVAIACDAIQPAALARDVRVECKVAPGVRVLGDMHRLQQIVGNLLSNAVKFTPRGGSIVLRAEVVDGDRVRLAVTDSGQGIAAEFLPFVFERFRQANATPTRSHGGLGLGLAIVRQLVELHDGTVHAESEGVGKGATFTVTLPMASPERPANAIPTPAASRSVLLRSSVLEGLDVLVVEDEPDTRDMIRTMAELFGGHVRVASNAAEAFASVQSKPPDLVLSDIGMPEEDGYSFIERVRKLPPDEGGDVPAVALTAFSRTEERARALRSGFDGHVAKPVEAAELIAVLEVMVNRLRKTS